MGKILFKELSKHGLYPIPFDLPLLKTSMHGSTSFPTVQNKAFLGKCVKHSLWHQRFGHPSNEIVSAMLKTSGISCVPKTEASICESCLLGKFHKLPFPKSSSRCQKPFELVHSDVWGPSPHLSIDGFRFFVLFVDDCTRFTWIFPMKNKSEVFHYFQYLYAFIHNQFSTTLKILRSDGGGEYMSTKFREFLNQRGIIHQVSCPYTPEQNGVSERKNRHVRETVVTLLQQASLPSIFWYHACATAAYLINRMPTQNLNMHSPFELLHHKLPPLDMMRVFGCACYQLMTPYRVDKLQPKTVRCVFISFANGYKGYICYNPISKKCIISIHVFFEETTFSYASLSASAQSPHSLAQLQTAVSSSAPLAYSQSFTKQLLSPVQAHPTTSHVLSSTHYSDSQVPVSDSLALAPVAHDQFNDYIDTTPIISTNSSAPSTSHDAPFSSTTDTSIQFQEQDGALSVHSQPGVSTISIVLDRASPPSLSQVSSFNILHPIEGLTDVPTNDYMMLTRAKRGVLKKKCLLSIMSPSNTDLSGMEPSNYKQALQSAVWKQAMQEEFDALIAQNTWTLVPLPPDKNLVSCKWLFKIKRNADGSISTHKARLVARGFSQEHGVDYDEMFSHVVRHTTVHLILGLAAHFG